MTKDFSKTSIEYNCGFIDGLLWVYDNTNNADSKKILRMVKNVLEANDKLLNDEEKQFEQLNKSWKLNYRKRCIRCLTMYLQKENGGLGYKEIIEWINKNGNMNIKF